MIAGGKHEDPTTRIGCLRHRWHGPRERRRLILVLALVLVAGGAVVGARQVTIALRGDRSVAAGDPDTAGGEAAAPPAEGQGSVGAVEPDPADPTPGPGAVHAPVLGEPTITPPDREPVPDTVSVQPGVVVGLGIPLPADPPDGAGPDSGGGTPFEPPFEIPDVTNGEAAPPPQPFGVGIWAEPVGHYARLTVGVNGGPDGLAALRVDFGDGNTHTLSAGRVDQLRDGGTVTLVHRYEPTLTPQPQHATATATDGAGQTRQTSVDFATQAEFTASFSALTITARQDCDWFGGRGDFYLVWNLDGRVQERRFSLHAGESYVEQKFRVGIDGIRYGDQHSYSWRIAELDSLPVALVELAQEFPGFSFDGGPAPALRVMEFGTHTYPVSGRTTTTGDPDCEVGYDYTYTLAMPDQAPNAR